MRDLRKIKVEGETLVKIDITESHQVEGEDKPIKCDISGTYRFRPHKDFIAALAKLRGHVLQMCELVPANNGLNKIPEKAMEPIHVNGVSFGGEDEDQGVVIIARKKLKDGRSINLITPFIRFENSDYEWAEDLYGCCIEVQREAELYMDEKHAPNPQLEMQLE